jgi:hypothetical protein
LILGFAEVAYKTVGENSANGVKIGCLWIKVTFLKKE